MTSLTEAWDWYQATRASLRLLERLAGKHWAVLPWEGSLGRDDILRDTEASSVQLRASNAQLPLDDLAVLVLFSAFESMVRDRVYQQVEDEARELRHPALRHAVDDALRGIEDGSFFRVLEPFKPDGHADLIEQVNQVRRYRNWVAHGRRGDPPGNPPLLIDPRMARDRLQRFLDLIQPPGPGGPS